MAFIITFTQVQAFFKKNIGNIIVIVFLLMTTLYWVFRIEYAPLFIFTLILVWPLLRIANRLANKSVFLICLFATTFIILSAFNSRFLSYDGLLIYMRNVFLLA